MIEISISAIKGGFRELYQTSTAAPQGIASAIRPDSGSPYAVGSEAYAISFMPKGLVCTKCKIIRDVLGSSRVGNIAISMLIPFGKKMSGNVIISMLDKLMQEYSDQNIDRDNNLGNAYENWAFVDDVLRHYDNTTYLIPVLDDDIEIIQPGTEEAAFVYYSSEIEPKLQQYFNNPYRYEYEKYKLIFFVDSKDRNKDTNPLKALGHSEENDLTGKIDLNDLNYTLLFDRQSGKLSIEVKVDKQIVKSGARIRKKNLLNIKYEQKYLKPFELKPGSWKEIEQSNPGCIEIDNEKKTILIKPILLDKPEELPIKINVEYETQEKPDYTIEYYKRNAKDPQEKEEKNPSSLLFVGEQDIRTEYCFMVRAVGYAENIKCYIPDTERMCGFQFLLKEEKTLCFEVVDKKLNKSIPLEKFSAKISAPSVIINNTQITITCEGKEEIDSKVSIEIINSNYKIIHSDIYNVLNYNKIEIVPRKINKEKYPIFQILVEQKKEITDNQTTSSIQSRTGQKNMDVPNFEVDNREQSPNPVHYKNIAGKLSTPYFITFKAGEHGDVDQSERGPFGDKNSNEEEKEKIFNDILDQAAIMPYFGYKRDNNWLFYCKPNSNKELSYYTITVHFKPIIPKRLVIRTLWILILILLSIGLYLYLKKNDKASLLEQSITSEMIIQYVEGNSLLLGTLNDYKMQWEKKKPKNKQEGGPPSSNWRPLFRLDKKENELDKKENENWDDIWNSLDRAIIKRKSINIMDFTALKELRYSVVQQPFKKALSQITGVNEIEVKNQLGKIDDYTLDQIAEKIDSIIKSIPPNPYQHIIDYLDGIELMEDILKKHLTEVGQDTELQERINKSLMLKTYLSKGYSKSSNINYLDSLKQLDFPYSVEQQNFKITLNKIDSTNTIFIGEKLNRKDGIKLLNLNEIANFIDSLIVSLNTQFTTSMQSENTTLDTAKGIDFEIVEYLKNNELNAEKLQEYKNTPSISNTLKASIQLCLDFWELNGSERSKMYWNFRDKVKNDVNLKDSALMSLLDEMCREDSRDYSRAFKMRRLGDTQK